VDPPHHPHQQGKSAAKSLGGTGTGEQHVIGARRATGNEGKTRQGKQPVQIHLNLLVIQSVRYTASLLICRASPVATSQKWLFLACQRHALNTRASPHKAPSAHQGSH